MKSIHKIVGAAAAIVAVRLPAQASVMVSPAITFRTERVVDNTGAFGNTNSNTATFDLRAGYVFPGNGLFLGALLKYDYGAFTSGSLTGTALGPSVGWAGDTFCAVATYVVTAQQTLNVGGADKKVSRGHGYQIDLTWTPEIMPGFGLGPQVTYRSIQYDRSQIGTSNETGDAYQDSILVPGLALRWNF